jgi:hypothetical protein
VSSADTTTRAAAWSRWWTGLAAHDPPPSAETAVIDPANGSDPSVERWPPKKARSVLPS